MSSTVLIFEYNSNSRYCKIPGFGSWKNLGFR